MKNLYDVLHENREEAIEKLKKHNNLIEFINDETTGEDERPWILICNIFGDIYELMVSKVKLDHYSIMLYIDGGWINEDECLLTSADNVYKAIDSAIK